MLVVVPKDYLDSRLTRFPATARRRSSPCRGLAAWAPTAPLFVGRYGDRITRGTLQYRVSGVDQRADGTHQGHTFDTAARENKVGTFLAAAVIPHLLRPEGRRGPSPGG